MSIIYFKKLYPDCKLISFEPYKVAYELLEDNIRSNNLEQIQLIDKAVYNRIGSIEIYYDPNNPGALAISALKERMPGVSKKVESVLLSDYINEEIDFLKIDVEGAEDLILEDLHSKNRLSLIDEMVIEYHHHVKPQDDKLSKILGILEEANFGYQICTDLKPPFNKKRFQDILIYAYKK